MFFFTIFQYLVVACLSLLCIWYVDHRWKRRRWYSCSKNVPGPYALPVIGAAYLFFDKPSNLPNILLKVFDSYSDIIKFWMGDKLVYFLTTPKYIEKVITNPKALDKDDFYKPMALILGDGLVTLGGTKWRRHRKLINPSFNQKILDNFVKLFNETSLELVKELEGTVGQRDVPLYSIIGKYIAELTCQTAMGVNINVESMDNVDEVLEKLNELMTEKLSKVWYHLDIIWYLSGMKKINQQYLKRYRSIVSEVIKKKMEDDKLRGLQQEKHVIAGNGQAPKRRAFLDMLMANTDLDEKEIEAEVRTFIAAATETTTNTLTAVFAILGIYSDIQEQVYKEIMDVIGAEEEVTPENLLQLDLTERVIKETLRFFPAAPIMSRYVSGDIDLGNNIILPEGVSVAFPLVHIHRCGKLWENPLKFDPDRFLPENIAKRHPFTYFGFSQGPRSCIGSKYAMMNMKVVVALVVRRMQLYSEYKAVGEIDVKWSAMMKMKDGPKVWIERR